MLQQSWFGFYTGFIFILPIYLSIFLRVSKGDGLEALIIVPNRQKECVQEAGKYWLHDDP